MRTELYSVRSNSQEVAYINNNLKEIATKINEKAGIKILFKTEIDCNPKKIKAELTESFDAMNPPEFYVFLNALDTKDISSFYTLFSPFIDELEKSLRKKYENKNSKTQSYPHIVLHTIQGLGGDYPAYCFTFSRRKFLVLPRITLAGAELTDYVSRAILLAKDIFVQNFDSCPDGYVYSSEKPLTFKDKLSARFASNKEKNVVFGGGANSITPEADATVQIEKAKTEPLAEQKTEILATTEVTHKKEEPKTEALFPDEKPINATPAPAVSKNKNKNKKEKSKKQADKPVTVKPEKAEAPTEPLQSEAPTVNNDIPKSSEDTAEKKPSGFKRFLQSFIPMKGDTKKSIILKIVVLLAIVIFFAGAWLLLKFYVVDPAVNSSDMDDIRAIFYSTPEDVTEETLIQEITNEQGSVVETIVVPVENENKATKTKNWKAVKKVNKEIVAWVKLNKTDIDYPVLFHKEDTEDSQFYLYRNYKKEYSDFGSIFLDYRCTGMADSKHVILHGHNMGSDKDAMFGSLINYTRKSGATKANTDYYKSHAIINYDTPKQNGEWIIFAAMKINVSNDKEIFNYLQTTFDNDAQFMNFIYNIKERSYLDVNVPINETDRILTLSTCSYETDNMRTIIVARKVRDGEDVSKYIKGVKAQTPVSSVSSDFISEFKNIKWYDGTKKPAGDGELKPMEKMETYTVIYYDAYGKVAHKEIVKAGDKAKGYPGAPPEKKKDQKNYYNFVEWKPDPTKIKITKDLKVYPVYRASKIVEGATDATAPGYVPMTQPSVAPKPTKPTTTNPKPTKPTKPTPSTGDET